jgi:hypothetical protein
LSSIVRVEQGPGAQILDARVELQALREERRELRSHSDQDLLDLRPLGDVEGVAGHLRHQRVVDLLTFDLVQREDVWRSEPDQEVHDPIDPTVRVPEMLHVPRREAVRLGHGPSPPRWLVPMEPGTTQRRRLVSGSDAAFTARERT